MKQILTDSDRTKAYEDLMGQSLRSQDTGAVLQYARAIEQRILEKIGDVVVYQDPSEDHSDMAFEWPCNRDPDEDFNTPLYAIPFIKEGE